jgi:predicted aspartyl protease
MQSPRWIAVITRCLASAPAFAACKIRQVREIAVRVNGNRMRIDAHINGADAKVLVDTGAAMTLRWEDAAARLGLPLEAAPGIREF